MLALPERASATLRGHRASATRPMIGRRRQPPNSCTQLGCRCVVWLNRETRGSARRGASFRAATGSVNGCRANVDRRDRESQQDTGRGPPPPAPRPPPAPVSRSLALRWHSPAVRGGQSRIVTVAVGHRSGELRDRVIPGQRTRSQPCPANLRSGSDPPSRGHADPSSGSCRSGCGEGRRPSRRSSGT